MATTALPEKLLGLDPRMIYEVATGLESPSDIASRYGITPEEWVLISARPEVQAAINSAMRELDANGTTFRNRAKLFADTMLKNLFEASLRGDIPVKDKAAALATVTKLAGLETTPTQAQQGSKFSITINIPQAGSVSSIPGAQSAPITVDVETPAGLPGSNTLDAVIADDASDYDGTEFDDSLPPFPFLEPVKAS